MAARNLRGFDPKVEQKDAGTPLKLQTHVKIGVDWD